MATKAWKHGNLTYTSRFLSPYKVFLQKVMAYFSLWYVACSAFPARATVQTPRS